MRRAAFLAAMIVAMALAPPAAFAQPPEAALRLYAQGQYTEAADLAARAGRSADNLVFAARARLAACLTKDPDADIDTLLRQAERDARAALALSPDAVDARVQWALTLGLRGRRASIAEALSRGYASRGKRLLDEAIAIAPDNAEAHALLGAWHLEVLRRGGSAGARMLGARRADGLAAFDRALALAPGDGLIALQYAIALTELDATRFSARIQTLLAAARTPTPRDALEAHGQAMATRLADVLAREGPSAAAREVRRLTV
jgi:tetratricopeptide (TPR) repeat protein